MEDEEKRQRERALKKAEFEKWKNPPKPNFVISKRSGSADEEQEVVFFCFMCYSLLFYESRVLTFLVFHTVYLHII